MTTSHATGAAAAPWNAAAAYLYLLDLGTQALAWEYLRRHPDYRSEHARDPNDQAFASRWGLRFRRRPDARRA